MTEDREKAFTVSILHDIGKVPLFMHGDRYRKLIAEAGRTGTDICSLESGDLRHRPSGGRPIHGDEVEVPRGVLAVIRKHHGRAETGEPLVDLVAKADRFVENPAADLGAEGIILQGRRDLIKAETKRISELMGVA